MRGIQWPFLPVKEGPRQPPWQWRGLELEKEDAGGQVPLARAAPEQGVLALPGLLLVLLGVLLWGNS